MVKTLSHSGGPGQGAELEQGSFHRRTWPLLEVGTALGGTRGVGPVSVNGALQTRGWVAQMLT